MPAACAGHAPALRGNILNYACPHMLDGEQPAFVLWGSRSNHLGAPRTSRRCPEREPQPGSAEDPSKAFAPWLQLGLSGLAADRVSEGRGWVHGLPRSSPMGGGA